MNEVKGFSTPPIKVSAMRRLIDSGNFAGWLEGLKKEWDEQDKALEIKKKKMLRIESVIVDHGRQPRKYHTWFIVFLLAVILLCLLIIALHHESVRTQKAIARLEVENKTSLRKIEVLEKEELTLTMRHIFAQMMAESGGDYGAVSDTGCVGSMQVMPATAAEYGIQEWELHHPVLGLDAGIRVMSDLWKRWQQIKNPELRWKLSLASYNCGYYRTKRLYNRHRDSWQDHIPGETRHYIKRTMQEFNKEVL